MNSDLMLSIASNPDDDELQLNSPAVSIVAAQSSSTKGSALRKTIEIPLPLSTKGSKKGGEGFGSTGNRDKETESESVSSAQAMDATIRIPQAQVQYPNGSTSLTLMEGNSTFTGGATYDNSVTSASSVNNSLIKELEARLMKHSVEFGTQRPFIHPASGADRPSSKAKARAASAAANGIPVVTSKSLERVVSTSGLNEDEKELLKEISNPMWAPFGSESMQEKERRVAKECNNYNGLTLEERRMVVSGFKAFDGMRTTKIVARPKSKVPPVTLNYTTKDSFIDYDTSQGSVRSLEDQAHDITPVYLRPATHVSIASIFISLSSLCDLLTP
jgi:hypothetical protein